MLTTVKHKNELGTTSVVKSTNKWLWIPAFLIVLVVGDRLGGFLLKKITEHSQFRFTSLYQDEAACDILLVGNSRGLSFYQPFIENVTNKKVFSLAYNGMAANLAEVFIKDYYNKYQAPKKLILEITFADRTNKELIPAFATYLPYSKNLQSFIKQKERKTYFGTKLSHLLRYNSEVFQRAVRHLNRSDKLWLTDRRISAAMLAESENLENISIDLIPELETSLVRIVKLAQKNGTKVELVVAPFLPSYGSALYNLNTYIKSIEDKTQLKVHNYAHAIKDPLLFGDYFHINIFGSEKLVEIMNKEGIFQ